MAAENNKANLLQKVLINGVEYELKGKVDFSDLTITKTGTTVPPTEPPIDPTKPPTDPAVDPNTGTRKEGTKWSKNPGDPSTWQVIEMTDADKAGLYKIVDKDGLNIIADIPSKDTAYKLVEYFKTHPFPPTETEPPTEPTDPTNPPTEPPTQPPVTGSGVTKDGVKIPYETTGKIEYTFKHNDRDDGKRMDFNNLKAGEYVNAAVVGYFAFPKDNAPNDEVSGKFSAMPHSGSNRTECFDMGTGIKDGATRIRYESVHPEYTGDLGKGDKGLPLKTKYIGYMYVRKNLPNGNVLCEQWQDQGDNEGSAPANKWVKLFSWQDPKYQFKDYKDGHTITIRVDGSNVVDDMKLKWLALVELK